MLLQKMLHKNFDILCNIHRQQNLNQKHRSAEKYKWCKDALPTCTDASQVERVLGDAAFNTPRGLKKPYAPQSRGYLLHIGAQGGEAQKFCDLIK